MRSNSRRYGEENPIGAPSFEEKVALLGEIDAYLRAKDPKVRQVTASVTAGWKIVEICAATARPSAMSGR